MTADFSRMTSHERRAALLELRARVQATAEAVERLTAIADEPQEELGPLPPLPPLPEGKRRKRGGNA